MIIYPLDWHYDLYHDSPDAILFPCDFCDKDAIIEQAFNSDYMEQAFNSDHMNYSVCQQHLLLHVDEGLKASFLPEDNGLIATYRVFQP